MTEPEQVRSGVVGLVGAGAVASCAALVAIAWLFVRAPEPRPAPTASPLEHGLIDTAHGGADARAAGQRALERTEWIDRQARRARIPIDCAIDAVAADPQLIGLPR